jgi:DNA-binding NarL/FixJ family response regulator
VAVTLSYMDGETTLDVRDDGTGFTPNGDGQGAGGGLGLRGMLAGEDDFEVVAEAASGVEAVRRCERDRPDVVLMDLQMPEMDGATATAEIAARSPGTRVLVLTTYDADADILRAVEAGAPATC